MSLRQVLVVAGLTLREMARRRVLWVLLGLVVVSVILVGWGTERLVTLAREDRVGEVEIRIGVSQVLILIAFMFSYVLAMSAAFLAAPAIASDVETGTVHAMLARPLRRAELVVGRWLGLSIVIGAYAALSGLLAIAVVALVSGHLPPQPFMAIGYLTFEAVAVLTVALTLGTRLPAIAAGAISVVLFGVGWFVGRAGQCRGRVRCPGAVPGDRGLPVPAADRRPVARRDLRPGAAARAPHVGGSHRRGEPVLRADAAARGVHGLERGVGRCSCWPAGVALFRRREL